MGKRAIILVLTITAVMVSILACSQNTHSSKEAQLEASFKEAGKTLGIEIPRPHYLPEGYEIMYVITGDGNRATLGISNDTSLIELEILWRPSGVIPYRVDLNAEIVEFNGHTGQLIESGDTKIGIVWNWFPERYKPGLIIMELFAPKDIPVEELALIAGSVD